MPSGIYIHKERNPLIPGMVFGRLTVIKLSEIRIRKSNGKNGFFYLCKCSCGKERTIDKQSLVGKDTQSCGCQRNERMAKAHRKPFGMASAHSVYQFVVRRAKKHKSKLLNFKEFYIIAKQKCYYCGQEPSQKFTSHDSHFYGTFIYNGLDRVDSTKGYEKENVVPCCKRCNQAKNDMTLNDFLTHIKKIYEYTQK
jgi:hypothetical protein